MCSEKRRVYMHLLRPRSMVLAGMSAGESNEDFDERLRKNGWYIRERRSSESAQRARINYVFAPPGTWEPAPSTREPEKVLLKKNSHLKYVKDFQSGKVKPGDANIYFNTRKAAKIWLGEMEVPTDSSKRKPKKTSRPLAKRRRGGPTGEDIQRQTNHIFSSKRFKILRSIHEKLAKGLRGESKVIPTTTSLGTFDLQVKQSLIPKAGWGLFTARFIPEGTDIVKLAEFGDQIYTFEQNTYDREIEKMVLENRVQVQEVLRSKESTASEKAEAISMNKDCDDLVESLRAQERNIRSDLRRKSSEMLKDTWKTTVGAWNDAILRAFLIDDFALWMSSERLNSDRITTHPYAVKGREVWEDNFVFDNYYDPFLKVWGFMNDPGLIPDAETSAAGNKRAKGNIDTKVVQKGTASEHVVFYSTRNIAAGEELLWNYGTSYDWSKAAYAPPPVELKVRKRDPDDEKSLRFTVFWGDRQPGASSSASSGAASGASSGASSNAAAQRSSSSKPVESLDDIYNGLVSKNKSKQQHVQPNQPSEKDALEALIDEIPFDESAIDEYSSSNLSSQFAERLRL